MEASSTNCYIKTNETFLSFTPTVGSAGDYICQIGEENKKNFTLVVLEVVGSPVNPVQIGETVILTCNVSDFTAVKKLEWQFNKINLANLSKSRIGSEYNQTLTLIELQERQMGTYKCFVELTAPGEKQHMDYELKAAGADTISPEKTSISTSVSTTAPRKTSTTDPPSGRAGHGGSNPAFIIVPVVIVLLLLIILALVLLKRRQNSQELCRYLASVDPYDDVICSETFPENSLEQSRRHQCSGGQNRKTK
nr:PREDICTED: uncharacterized protein LOC102349836 [Latimeria chalumnae]|eukprot:XP_014345785.1 PREDICTED: uncharacterized protein LOC102349836 [Latimeria chalumnae]